MLRSRLVALLFCGSIGLGAVTAQQPQPAPYVPRQSDRPTPVDGDEPGFQPIFDGKTLSGWDGNPTYWRVEEGALVGEITAATVIKSNTFIIWRGGRPRDFELKLDYRITPAGNSGINYRSVSVPDPVTPGNAFALRGYQFDLDGGKRYVGNNYEEKGRLFLAVRGQVTRVVGGRPPVVLSTFGDPVELAKLATDDWNAVHLIIRGNTLMHFLNGRLMSVTIDDDTPNRPADGLLGVQVHVGPPMKVEYRNIRLKSWSQESGVRSLESGVRSQESGVRSKEDTLASRKKCQYGADRSNDICQVRFLGRVNVDPLADIERRQLSELSKTH